MSAVQFDPVNQYLSTRLKASAPSWKPLLAGSSNKLYSADVNGEALVLRLNAPVSRAFGVNRQREAGILKLLAGYQWAPSVICNAPEEGWLLMQWHGEPGAMPLSGEDQQRLLDMVSQWHQLTSDDAELQIDYQALFEDFRPQVAGLPMEQPLLALIEGAQKALASLPALPKAVTHHDLHAANICFDDNGQMVVVDWEYGAIGNPWFDLAALNIHFNIQSEYLAMLPIAAELEQLVFQKALKRANWLLQVLETLWYWARGLEGTELTMKQLVTRTIQLLKQ